MNYMEKVAEMLGVEIGEEFKIGNEYSYKFTEECLMALFPNGKWYIAPYALYEILNGKYKVIKLPRQVLTEKEKEYLSYVINPFKDDVYYICKNSYNYNNYRLGWIRIGIKDGLGINFPTLKKDMYKGMEFDKRYSLEELGL